MSSEAQVQAGQPEVESKEFTPLSSLLSKVNMKKPDETLSLEDAITNESDSGRLMFALNRLIEEIGATGQKIDRLDKQLIDLAISNIDKKISAQVRTIMHHSEFKSLEASWRGLQFAVNRTDFENIDVEIINCPKEKLMEDFEDVGENILESGLYKQLYDQAYNTPGADPVSFVVANYELDRTARSMDLLEKSSKVCAASHCPLITSVGSSFFGVKALDDLTNKSDIDAIFDQNEYVKWQSFRKTEDSKYVGLTMNRFMLRLPYDTENAPAKSFNFEEFDPEQENIDANDYLWGNPAFAFMANVNRSFAKNGWAVNIRGPKAGGMVENLPVHLFKSAGSTQKRLPTEMQIFEDKEYKLSLNGLIPLSPYRNRDYAVFFGAHSAQAPGKNADAKLAANLPYLFLVSRLSHYLKVIQRQEIGSSKDKLQLEEELNKWINELVTRAANPSEEQKAKYPLRDASVKVEDNPDAPGYYQVTMTVRPHFQIEGVNIDLSLVSRMESK
ncbi:EvpB/family type VI secretion protein [Candidatus Magnetomorum sp. HK-1]|nr:EvpB/family type VI secretion protein [Candidatus Magnetomorum sp. HK-1]